jgi:hypothetical protein
MLPNDKKRFCAICASRRLRNLIDFKKYSVCLRCYVYYFVLKQISFPAIDFTRSYEEAKASDWTPSLRYGSFLSEREEKMLVNHFREKLIGANPTEKTPKGGKSRKAKPKPRGLGGRSSPNLRGYAPNRANRNKSP